MNAEPTLPLDADYCAVIYETAETPGVLHYCSRSPGHSEPEHRCNCKRRWPRRPDERK